MRGFINGVALGWEMVWTITVRLDVGAMPSKVESNLMLSEIKAAERRYDILFV